MATSDPGDPGHEDDPADAALRADIQHAVDQAERGEVIRDFSMEAFLEERHREQAANTAV